MHGSVDSVDEEGTCCGSTSMSIGWSLVVSVGFGSWLFVVSGCSSWCLGGGDGVFGVESTGASLGTFVSGGFSVELASTTVVGSAVLWPISSGFSFFWKEKGNFNGIRHGLVWKRGIRK